MRPAIVPEMCVVYLDLKTSSYNVYNMDRANQKLLKQALGQFALGFTKLKNIVDSLKL